MHNSDNEVNIENKRRNRDDEDQMNKKEDVVQNKNNLVKLLEKMWKNIFLI